MLFVLRRSSQPMCSGLTRVSHKTPSGTVQQSRSIHRPPGTIQWQVPFLNPLATGDRSAKPFESTDHQGPSNDGCHFWIHWRAHDGSVHSTKQTWLKMNTGLLQSRFEHLGPIDEWEDSMNIWTKPELSLQNEWEHLCLTPNRKAFPQKRGATSRPTPTIRMGDLFLKWWKKTLFVIWNQAL